MKPNHVNEQCAQLMGWKFFQTGEQLPHGKYAGGPGWWTGSTFVWVKAFTPRTNRDHLQMCIEFAAKDEDLWARFNWRVWKLVPQKTKDSMISTAVFALTLPTLTLATLLVEAWEETQI